MLIYWSMIVMSGIVGLMGMYSPRRVKIGRNIEERSKMSHALIFFAVVVFFIGLRSAIADTTLYIKMFNQWPSTLAELDLDAVEKDKGFTVLSVLFKQLISSDSQAWLFAITLISAICVMIPLYKHSVMFGMSAFLFIATTDFTWMMNGVRQFLVVAILFSCMSWIANRKFVYFAIITLLLSTVHGSALLMLPIYFIVQGKPWSIRMWISIIACVILMFMFDRLMPSFSALLSETQYEGYVDYFLGGSGSNIVRAIVALIPPLIAFVKQSEIKKISNKYIDLAINMSVFNFFCMLLAAFSNGIFMGRLYIYFALYNLILLPWLIKKTFYGSARQMVTFGCIVAYLIWFYYQMVITWNYIYCSDILNTAAWLN